jgi:DNA topoisomerase-2
MSINTSTQDLAQQYQQKTDKQHILDNPDTYIGSVEQIDTELWVHDNEQNKIILKAIDYIPGLYKLFDEGIVNCRDHVIRMIQSPLSDKKCVSNINISIDELSGMITMENDGNGIDVAKHPEYNIWIPEMIFGHLRTSTNYNKDEKRIVGGKNGFGFKLVLIWSTYGRVETVDHNRGLKYVQEFRDNLNEMSEPVISKVKSTKPYTKVSFIPDYKRLGISGLTPTMLSLLKKRVYDIGAVTDQSTKKIKISLNDQQIPIKNFQQYIDYYIGTKDENKRIYEEGNERWEYCVALSPTHEFIQISFVNGIATFKGGKHVDYIMGQITRKLCDYIEKKKKIRVNPNSIKEQLILFLRCDIENPAFDSQTKDCMNTPSNKFGSSCTVSDGFIEKVAKMGVMDLACSITEAKESKLAKRTDGVKSKNIRGIPKLIDANWAGTDKSNQCMIIFCEGDSAKAGIVSGLSSSDRNIIGVYPMKGKLLNVRGEQVKKIAENKEIAEIKKILGLETGKEYKTAEDVAKSLRYGKVMIMCDQDVDGSHIKGLCINLFQSEWNSLSKIPGFIGFMNTPILKARKGQQELRFYNDGEYEEWKRQTPNPQSWKIKYYKGLGTSTGKEFREYFQEKKIVEFAYNCETSDNAIDMVFNKKRADDRKGWLGDYNRESYLDTSKCHVSYEDFIHKELIHFSKYDCDRSIPNVMDGLKISLRKILYSAFKKNLNTEIKVAQFSGYVSEHSGYHHGEASLNAAIVGMAQNFVGSNNINLFQPNGQFGTRLQGGKDSASERYIFTQLSKITRCIFPEMDDKILKYLNDDGLMVEPLYYAPILPMVLVNGSKGIGTGFSTEILCYNPLEIICYLKNKVNPNPNPNPVQETAAPQFIPYYEGFTGTIVRIGDAKFLVKGKYEKVGVDKIRITELPVGQWTDDFKEYIESLTETTDKNGKKVIPIVKDYDDMSKDTTVDFVITLHKGKLEELESCTLENDCNGLEKQFRLFSTLSTTNMHLFDAHDKLKKYANVVDIIEDYYETRIVLYQTRKDYMIDMLSRELLVLSNKTRYIKENLEGTIDLRRKSREVVNQMLSEKQYVMINDDGDYKYLTELPMNSVTEEKVAQLEKQHESKKNELEELRKTTIQQMWFRELELLENEYIKYKNEFTENVSKSIPVKSKPNANPQRKSTSTSLFVIPPGGDVKKAKKPKQSALAGGNKM